MCVYFLVFMGFLFVFSSVCVYIYFLLLLMGVGLDGWLVGSEIIRTQFFFLNIFISC